MYTPSPIPTNVIAHCAAALRVLAHPVRLRIADLLSSRRLSVGELAAALGIAQAVVSQHLAKMRRVGLVNVQREAQSAYYRIDNPACTTVLDCIRQHFTGPVPAKPRRRR